jgi:hypothetical protein
VSKPATIAQSGQETEVTQSTEANTEPTTSAESFETTSAGTDSEQSTTVAGNAQSTQASVVESQPTFIQTQSENIETTSAGENIQPTSAGEDSAQSTTVAGNEQSTQFVGNEAQPTTSAAVESSESTTAGENSAQSTTVNGNEQGTTQTASAESQPTSAQTQSDSSDVTSSAAGSDVTKTQSVGLETESASVQTTQSFGPGVTETKSFVTTTRPAETESNSPETTTGSAAEETSAATTTTGFPTEETITPIRDARPVQEDCLGQNLIDNGNFDGEFGAGDGWELFGNAALTYNGEFGPNARCNSGESAVAIRWPQTNGVRAAFKRTVPDLVPGLGYLFGWAYHVANGDNLPDNQCTITATFGDVTLAPVDPFAISNAWVNYRNNMNHVATQDTEVEVVFELSCSGSPKPFTILVDDVFLTACQK